MQCCEYHLGATHSPDFGWIVVRSVAGGTGIMKGLPWVERRKRGSRLLHTYQDNRRATSSRGFEGSVHSAYAAVREACRRVGWAIEVI